MTGISAFTEHIVRQGASLLDQISPDWWSVERVNLDTLDIASSRNCLLAQSFGATKCSCCPVRSYQDYSVGLSRVIELAKDACLIGDEDTDRCDFSTEHGFSSGYVKVDMAEFPDIEVDDDGEVWMNAERFTGLWRAVIRERRDAANDPLMTLINEAG